MHGGQALDFDRGLHASRYRHYQVGNANKLLVLWRTICLEVKLIASSQIHNNPSKRIIYTILCIIVCTPCIQTIIKQYMPLSIN